MVSLSTSAKLYRKLCSAVILAGLCVTGVAVAQSVKPAPLKRTSKGPRALALVELAANGKAHLIPIAILVEGEFFDASAYKASPVPMALETGTVYEGIRSGTSVGFFTVRGALHGTMSNDWIGDGTWLAAGAKPPNAKHQAESKPRDMDPQDAPPVLKRASPEKAKSPEPAAQPAPAPQTAAPPPATASAPATPPPPPASTTPAPAVPAPAPPADDDPNHPVLRRSSGAHQQVIPDASRTVNAKSNAAGGTGSSSASSPNAKNAKGADGPVQTIPAISDAAGPDSHTYIYPMKPEDAAQLRKKVMAMAASELAARIKEQAAAVIGAPTAPASKSKTAARAAAAKPSQPNFENVQFHVLDLSSSNEPILVLTATAQMSQTKTDAAPNPQYMLSLVARQDIYGELHKAFSSITDAQHLDVTPRYDFIDAVDADGDGRAELLFRKVSDAATAYSVYRVIGQQLWPLFDGVLTP